MQKSMWTVKLKLEFVYNMAGYVSLYLIIDDFFDNTPYQIIVSYVCNEIRLIVSDSNFDKREDVPRMIGYVENVVPRYLEEDYRSHFRISKTVVESLFMKDLNIILSDSMEGD